MTMTTRSLTSAAYDTALAAAVAAATAHDAAQHAAYIANRAAERAEAVYTASCILLDAASFSLTAAKED